MKQCNGINRSELWSCMWHPFFTNKFEKYPSCGPVYSYDCFSCDGSFTLPKLHFAKKIEFSVVSVSSKSKFCARPFHPTSCPLLQWQRERDGITLSLTFAAPVLRWRHKSVMFRWSDNDNDPFTNNPKDQWSTRGNHCRYCQVSKALQSQKTCQMVMKQCSIPDLTDPGLLLDTSSRRCWTTRV